MEKVADAITIPANRVIVTAEDLTAYPGASSDLHAYVQRRMGPRLDAIATIVSDRSNIPPDQILPYLDQRIQEIKARMNGVVIPLRHNPEVRAGAWRRLSSVVNNGDNVNLKLGNISRIAGIFGHAEVLGYMAGKKQESGDYPGQQPFEVPSGVQQLSFFESSIPKEDVGQLRLPNFAPVNAPATEEVFSYGRIRDDHLSKMDGCISAIEEKAGGVGLLYEHPAKAAMEVYGPAQELRRLMMPIAGRRVDRLYQHFSQVPNGEVRWLLSLMSWARALITADQLNEGIAHPIEIKDLDERFGVRSGRIDSLRWVGDEEGPLTAEKKLVLAAEASRPYKYSGDILERWLAKHPGLQIMIEDFKFPVGDGVKAGDVISKKQVKDKPLPSHETQVLEYAVRVLLDLFARKRFNGEQDLLFKNLVNGNLITGVRILYPFADEVVVHQSDVTPEKIKAILKRYGSVWSKAEEEAIFHEIDNGIVDHVVTLLNGKLYQLSFDSKKSDGNGHSGELFKFKGVPSNPIVEAVQEYQEYLDQNKTILLKESKKGESYPVVNLENLRRAIDAGLIDTEDRFDWVQGGKFLCPNPDHDDNKPSCHLYLQEGHIHCFSCGFHCSIDTSSVPGEMNLPTHAWKTSIRHLEKVVIPEDHARIMAATQELLSKGLADSKGSMMAARARRYIQEERELDLDLVLHYGGGFADLRTIHGLLDQNFSLEELERSGLVSYSSRLSYDRSLGPLLEKRGMTKDQIVRNMLDKKIGEISSFVPSFTLKNRITVPMEHEDEDTGLWSIACISGRVLGEGEPKYYKLSARDINSRKIITGGYLLKAAVESNWDPIVVEGMFDVWSLIQGGYHPPTAIVGMDNGQVLNRLAQIHEDRAILVAMDNDEMGIAKAKAIAGLLSEFGFKGLIRNFSYDFFQAYPEGRPDDYNTWWVEKVRRGGDQVQWERRWTSMVENAQDPFFHHLRIPGIACTH